MNHPPPLSADGVFSFGEMVRQAKDFPKTLEEIPKDDFWGRFTFQVLAGFTEDLLTENGVQR